MFRWTTPSPDGAKIQLALTLLRHTAPDDEYRGILLSNPGGPGGSGLGLWAIGDYVPKDAGYAYDAIGFDPRGVGRSVPALNCIEDYFEAPRPPHISTTKEIEETWLRKSKEYAAACSERGGELLEHLRTTDVARDIDLIRAAMGAPKINFIGFSYGTYIGQVYATLFPDRVEKMVLDSSIDPTRVFYQANLDQDVAFHANFEAWWAWVAEYDDVYQLGATKDAVAGLVRGACEADGCACWRRDRASRVD
jgi:pimeloyl-ACP methyl ester carboxylesterase